jgi:type II secretory pathway component GspD/PulD (secretin)
MIFVESTFLTYDSGDPNNRPTIYGLEQIGDWAFEVGGDRFRGAFDITGNEGLVFEILPKNQRMPFEDFRAMWQYIFAERDAKIISSPRVAVIDGFTATISVTENQPFIIDGGVVIDQFGNPIPAPDIVTFIPTGNTLTITPYIDDYGNVTMAMNPTESRALSAPELINGNLVFGTATASISTVLRMRDGETIILGGMRTRIHDVTKRQIPLLGDLPLIGPLFGRTTINNTDSNLIIIMTIHLVGN